MVILHSTWCCLFRSQYSHCLESMVSGFLTYRTVPLSSLWMSPRPAPAARLPPSYLSVVQLGHEGSTSFPPPAWEVLARGTMSSSHSNWTLALTSSHLLSLSPALLTSLHTPLCASYLITILHYLICTLPISKMNPSSVPHPPVAVTFPLLQSKAS